MTQLIDQDEEPRRPNRRARVFGRIGRLVVGVFLVFDATLIVMHANADFHVQLILTWAGLLTFYTLVHWIIATRFRTINPWFGAVLAVLPVAIVYVIGTPAVRVASTSFIGVSLVLDGLAANAGCEVRSLPGFILGKRTHLVCIAFSPIDWFESRFGATKEPTPL